MSESSAADLLPPAEYQEQRARLFPSPNSLTWYIRRERVGLANAGALLLHTGRYLIDPARFDAYVIEAAKSAAAA